MTNPTAEFVVDKHGIPTGTRACLLLCSGLLLSVVLSISLSFDLGTNTASVSGLVWLSSIGLILHGLPRHHNHVTYGAANAITTIRLAGTALLAGLIPLAHDSVLLTATTADTLRWALTAFLIALVALDGLDGYLARRDKTESAFGARFDMEVDAFLALIIALLLWRAQEQGVWVLGLGLLRYAFVAGSWIFPPLRAPLFPSMRRKIVCVIQLLALCMMLSPLLSGTASLFIGGLALVCLGGSFLRDIIWLYQQPTNQPNNDERH